MLDNMTLQTMIADAPDVVLSLYLHVNPGHQPNQNTPAAWEIFAKNALREIASENSTDAWANIRKQTETFLESYTPTGKSLVLFVGNDDWIESYDLPIALDNHYAYGKPDVVRLLWALDEYERYMVVLVDSEQAYFHSAYLGHGTQQEVMSIDFDAYDFGEHKFITARSTGRTTGETLQGGGPDSFEDMKSEHIRRFHNDVAERIRKITKDSNQKHIILGGSEQAAHQVKHLLHDSMKAKVGAIISLPVDAEPHIIADSIRSVAANLERDYELDLVNEVIGFAKSGGRGALGYNDIKHAFQMQQVEKLILPHPMDDTELAAELTLQALHLGSTVELVHGSAASRLNAEAEGMAARLYYSITEPDKT